MGLIAGFLWTKSQKSPLFPGGGGHGYKCLVNKSPWCDFSCALIRSTAHRVSVRYRFDKPILKIVTNALRVFPEINKL